MIIAICKCTLEVASFSVVAHYQGLVVGGPLVVDHAAAQLLRVRPDHLGVVTSAGAESEGGT